MDSAALAILLGQGISSAGQIYANQSNIANQRWTNNINWAINAANNATQIDMANTAHQREVADLKAAGLNPILSAGGHGSAVPSLVGGDQRSTHIDNPADGVASSASQLARYMARDYKAQVEQAEADVEATRLDNDVQRMDNKLLANRYHVDWLNTIKDKTQAELDLEALGYAAGIDFTGLNPNEHVNSWLLNNKARWDDLVRLRAKGLEAEAADASNVNWRNNLKAVGGAATDLGGVLNSAGGLMRHIRTIKRLRR